MEDFNFRLSQIRGEISNLEARIDFLSTQIKRFSGTSANFLLKIIDKIYQIRDFF